MQQNIDNQTVDRIQEMANKWWQAVWDKLINNPFTVFLIKLSIASIIVIILLIISKKIASTIRKRIVNKITLEDEEYIIKIWKLVEDIIFYSLAIFSIFLGAEIVGLDVWLLLWWLSIGIWFAFKEILGNMLAGIMILTTKDYNLWDIIEIEINWEKLLWRIEEITIRYIVLRLFNMRRVIIPNLLFVTTPVKTFSAEDFIRLETTISVHYDSDLNKVLKIIKETLSNLPYLVEKDNIRVMVNKFADSWIDIKVWFFFDPNKWYTAPEIISNVNQAIFDAFKKEWIVIPYPHTVLTVDKNDKNLIWTALYVLKNSFNKIS
jgi:small conductance mechanosensitive channel